MTTPTTPDLAAIAERCAEEIMDNHSKSKSIHVLEALTEAVAPLRAEVDEQGRGLIDAAHRLALAQSELTTLRADKERLDWLEKYTLFEVRLGYDGIPMISMGRPTMETPPLRYQLDQAIDSAIQNEKGNP